MGEIKMIPVWRDLPEVMTKRMELKPNYKRKNRLSRGWSIFIGALISLCMIQWVAIYLMLPSVF